MPPAPSGSRHAPPLSITHTLDTEVPPKSFRWLPPTAQGVSLTAGMFVANKDAFTCVFPPGVTGGGWRAKTSPDVWLLWMYPRQNVFLLAFILGRFSPRPAAGAFLWSRDNIPQVAFHAPRLLASFNTSSQRLSRLRRSTPWLLADFTRKFFVPDSALGVSRSTTYVESSSQPVGLPDSSPLGFDRSTLIRGLPRT